jgi:hypothetical protein
MKHQPVLRVPPGTGELKIFSSDEGRELLEQQFLVKGAYIRTVCSMLNEYQRPLGNMVLETLGFGSTIVTFRNCPNNAPLVFWAGEPWHPHSDHDEGGGDLDAKSAEQLAAHRRHKSLRQQGADFRLEGGKVALVGMKIGADQAAARDRREHGDAVKKPELVERQDGTRWRGSRLRRAPSRSWGRPPCPCRARRSGRCRRFDGPDQGRRQLGGGGPGQERHAAFHVGRKDVLRYAANRACRMLVGRADQGNTQ